jgi:hypothetical protein
MLTTVMWATKEIEHSASPRKPSVLMVSRSSNCDQSETRASRTDARVSVGCAKCPFAQMCVTRQRGCRGAVVARVRRHLL